MLKTTRTTDSFLWPVRIPQAVDGGRVEHSAIQMQFRRFSREELATLRDDATPGPDDAPISQEEALERDTDYILKIATNWKDVDVDGDTEFTRDNLRAVLNAYPMATARIVEAFWQAHNGEAARKKLVDLAEWLCGGGPEYCRACRKARGEDDDCDDCNRPEPWPENAATVAVFSACHTQWRRTVAAGPSGAVVTFDGLDYPGVATVIRAHGHRGVKAAAVFNSVQIMEEAALEVLNKS